VAVVDVPDGASEAHRMTSTGGSIGAESALRTGDRCWSIRLWRPHVYGDLLVARSGGWLPQNARRHCSPAAPSNAGSAAMARLREA
jgi:hypothetical protein